ncbi:MAG TPA: PHB depolymerase family esterase [Candidatus Binatia bacterium]|jgi:polyhydroxybutyrate depolymerase
MNALAGVLAILLFGLPPGQTGAPRPWRHAVDQGAGDSTHTIVVDGRPRTYLAHVPPNYDGQTPLPVVLVFHGGVSNAAITVRFTGLSDKADEARFLAVYPSGTGRLARALTWNAGSCCGYAQHEHVDDVAFVRALLDDLAGHFAIDARRIYATGISNGGMMVHRLAAELADRIAAVASVSGPLSIETIHPSRPVSVMHFHGTADEFVPFAGGTGEKSLASIRFRSAPDSVAAWARADGCPSKPDVAALPVKEGDPTRVRRERYGPCKDGAEVVFYVIDGGGHAWPGREAGVQFLGTATQSISANDLMWEFFQKHARQ